MYVFISLFFNLFAGFCSLAHNFWMLEFGSNENLIPQVTSEDRPLPPLSLLPGQKGTSSDSIMMSWKSGCFILRVLCNSSFTIAFSQSNILDVEIINDQSGTLGHFRRICFSLHLSTLKYYSSGLHLQFDTTQCKLILG